MSISHFPDGRIPVLLSAHTEELLTAEATGVADYLDRSEAADVAAVAAMLSRLRRRRRFRAVVRAHDTTELTAALRALAAGEEHPLVAVSSRTTAPRTAFVFPGNGNQWPSMGVDAYRQLPVYRVAVDRCAEAFVAAGIDSPLAFLADSADREWTQIHSQSGQFTHAVGLTAVWQALGIEPDVTVGHSLGEIAAAYVAGAMTLPDAVAVVIARAGALDSLAGDFGAASLGVSVEEAQQALSDASGWMELSVVNSAASVVVSGERSAVAELVSDMQSRGRFARVIAMSFPAHTSALDPLRDNLLAGLPEAAFGEAAVPFVGSVTGDVVAAGTEFGEYWYRNLRSTVRFDRAAAAVRDSGVETFVEMSAHPALLHALADTDAPLIVGSGRRDEALVEVLSDNIATVAVADPNYHWGAHIEPHQPLLPGFPHAPMAALHLWAQPEPLPAVAGLTVSAEHWLPQPEETVPLIIRRAAVLALPGPNGELADRLQVGVQAHLGTVLVDSADADLLIVVAPMLDHPDAEAAVTDLAELVGAGLCDYPNAVGPQCTDVWLVTVGGEHVLDDEPVALPAQAALAAMHRSIGFDHPDQSFRHLDLASWDLDDTTAVTAVETMLGTGTEVALRDSQQYRRTLQAVSVAEEPAAGLLDNVVITGGSGAVGRHFARTLAAAGARRIVLVSRGGTDLQELVDIAAGTELVSVRCDITSPEQISASAAAHAGAGATLVVHAAGAAVFGTTVGADDFLDTAAAKLTGLARMAELWPLRPEGRILVCSSVSGLWGGLGHVAYAAANRMQDVVAGQLRAKGLDCVAVRWGLWPGAGIVDAEEVARIERAGLREMDPDAAIEAALGAHGSAPVIFSADTDRLATLLGELAVATEPTAPQQVLAVISTGTDTEDVVRHELSAVLKLGDPAGIDLTAALFDLGLDSLLALDLRKRLRRGTGRSVPLAGLLSGITGIELVDLLSDRSEEVES
ncbi:SDR family NAD(P)-dependent oxidoreductase [Mycobacterium sp. CBMA293]|uniref:mycobactin polyketide synthase MbtD n=2 Tax=Mycolicibacterium TaxID=1866885 RepID=UPI0012DC08E5|nr:MULTISPECIES: mycobactin polyketide synthase MbtD [unclassified Mycolicibacterium]MUL45715.1 SDR family NAD(P)-dependent oxidoreductase [Mycolicibacterium sp. CBMA 360]MUL60386.1 SDR family NAD(P)-dependent oxidoreductase [Mycolicibacterium sp. CBMA 335]MUL71402.1 SDR family NAD(P)-dependent oxidoreductase [Mycolicibacterium sp. CBMA 311]MUL73173.1 SDR family NAD(P)-dependent oxidoreductase [Mycolicibacterium sp. CBMA 311]MUL97018.1 SDR family NAD(P)-dependent oxidoreductase [Mycolicibacter